ncbi:MAG: carbohydrate ABC transporter permease [Deltaproteobacteria bacterium]|nr:MAG: carbohydrate ABC transporter permease [Deltaproteobacteria bacterium]
MTLKNTIARILGKPFASYVLLIIILAIMLAPIIFTAFTSFKPRAETFRWPPTYFPETPTLQAYHEVLFRSPMVRHLLNSLIVAVGTTSIVIAGGLFTAYGLSQYEFKGSKIVLLIFIATRIIPPISLLVPFYIIMTFLHLINTYVCLMIVNTFLWYPFAVWMLKSFFDIFPRELIDSAIVDGCTRTSAFLRIVVPVSAIGIAAVAIITFLWTWNEFLYGMIFTNTREVQPITVGAHYFVGDELVQWDSIAATAMFTALPGIMFFSIAQRAIVKGLTAGAVKG